jgi:hypothetical protein
MKTIFTVAAAFYLTVITGYTRQNLLTVAEKSDFKATSEHKDVIDDIYLKL